MTATSPTHRFVIGFNYEPKKGKPRRYEVGAPVKGLPQSVVDHLDEMNAIEPIPAEGDA